MGNSRQVLILSAVSGSGHRVTARALASLLRDRRYSVSVVPVHRILGTFDYIGELFYNFCLIHRLIRLVGAYHRLTIKLIRLYRPVLLAAVRRYFRGHRFDVIVSCIPWVNHYFIKSVPHIPLITVITDFCSSQTHPWIQHRKQHLVCPTPKAVQQARSFGIPDDRVHEVSGNIISPGFYAAVTPERTLTEAASNQPLSAAEKAAALKAIGLDPARNTALVFYGGYGPGFMEQLVQAIDRWNIIVIWGGNKKRVEKPLCVNIGFTEKVPYYMRLADLLIGKPGPGVIAEAVHCNLPVLVDASKNSVLPQELDVLEWIDEARIGTCFRSLADFKRKMSSIREADLVCWKNHASSMQNNALFETVEVIEKVATGK